MATATLPRAPAVLYLGSPGQLWTPEPPPPPVVVPPAPAKYELTEYLWKPGKAASVIGTLTNPKGFIFHGSRSTVQKTILQEFYGTADYALITEFLFHDTIGPDRVAHHMDYRRWGWNARGASSHYVAFEFAQTGWNYIYEPIDDDMVEAAVWAIGQARLVHPTIPLYFVTHADVDGTLEYGSVYDGKTDAFPRGDPRAADLKARVLKRCHAVGIY